MLANLNRQLFEATVFDSGALGLTTSIVHQFTAAGIYSAIVRKDAKHMGNVSFEVRDDATAMQLDIDLAKTMQGSKDSCCGSQTAMPVSSKGYVVFHTTSGSGWSVHVGEGKHASFDSTRLTKGDIFALTLLEPTRYKIENKLGSAKGSVTVEFTKGDIKRLHELKPIMVTAGKSFDPQSFKLVSTQGLVFRIETDARIVITRKEERKAEPERGRIRFQRPRVVETRPSRKAS